MRKRSLPPPVLAWFTLDAVLALTPQVHHLASGRGTILGVPRVLAYLFGTGALTAASVVVAYLLDESRGGR